MFGIYLGRCRAFHPNYNLDYNDIVPGYHINILGDMLSIDLSNYDFIIATPPCNYYSKCNYRRDVSEYALSTKDLLPGILFKCIELNKPFIIENVRNYKLMKPLYDYACKNGIFIYEYGRHVYFTNIMFDPRGCKQRQDFTIRGKEIRYGDDFSKYRQGGFNVHNVIDYWLSVLDSYLTV